MNRRNFLSLLQGLPFVGAMFGFRSVKRLDAATVERPYPPVCCADPNPTTNIFFGPHRDFRTIQGASLTELADWFLFGPRCGQDDGTEGSLYVCMSDKLAKQIGERLTTIRAKHAEEVYRALIKDFEVNQDQSYLEVIV